MEPMAPVRQILFMHYLRIMAASNVWELPEYSFDPSSWLEGLDDAAWKG